MKFVNISTQYLITFQIWLGVELKYDVSFFIILMSGVQAKQETQQHVTLSILPEEQSVVIGTDSLALILLTYIVMTIGQENRWFLQIACRALALVLSISTGI